MNRSLVDSNMFVRALILSLEHFDKHADDIMPGYDFTKTRLLAHIADFQNQIDVLANLIKLINVENLTQENVSCLNTTLVFLMFANQKSFLPKYLTAMQALSLTRRNALTNEEMVESGSQLLKNFRDLLVFWQEHYLHKDKDCSALERSSRIPFDYWKKTVATLVNPDQNQETALAHYIPSNSTGSCIQPQVERDS